MHALIVGISDEAYEKLIALSGNRIDHSWLATHLLEDAVSDAPRPGVCKMCGDPFFVRGHPIGRPRLYCSEKCQKAGHQERKRRWWRRKGKAWREKSHGVGRRSRGS